MLLKRKEPSRKTKEVFIHSSYYYYCEKPVCMRYTVTQFARESVWLWPFRGSYVRELELSHNNPVSRIKNNSCTQFALEDAGTLSLLQFICKRMQIVYLEISSNDFKKSPQLYNICNSISFFRFKDHESCLITVKR